MNEKSLNFKLKAVYFLVYSALACYYPFITVFFGEKGLSFSEIGIVFAASSLVSVAFQPIWGYVTDKYSTKKSMILTVGLISGAAILLLPISRGFIMVLVGIIIYMIFQSSICSITDAYCYDIIDKVKGFQYGQIRLMGSLSYAIFALLVGIIVKEQGINSSFYLYALLIGAASLVLFTIPYKGKSTGNHIKGKDIYTILSNKRFMVLITAACFINISLGANGSYIAILIKSTGGDVTKIGMLWFILAISELPVFYMGNKLLKRYGELNVCTVSLFLYTIRFLLDALCTDYRLVIAVQVLQGITYPLFIMSSLQYLNRILPSKLRTSGITLYSAVGGGIGGFIGNYGGGLLLENISIFGLYRILAACSFGAMVVIMYLALKDKFIREV